MNTISNKQQMQNVFSEMAKGNLDPLVEIMADDMQWSWMGTESWVCRFSNGKLRELREYMDTELVT